MGRKKSEATSEVLVKADFGFKNTRYKAGLVYTVSKQNAGKMCNDPRFAVLYKPAKKEALPKKAKKEVLPREIENENELLEISDYAEDEETLKNSEIEE